MEEKDKLKKKVDEDLKSVKSNIMYFHDKDIAYAEAMSSWFAEITTKNRIIHYSRNVQKEDKEKIRRRRGRVFYTDFGVGVGSEFGFPHFCVVIKEYTYTAIVVPLSSVKESEQPWKNEDSSYIKIGKIPGLPDKDSPDSYALVGHIQSVSKQRLSYFKHKGKHLKTLKLNDTQMDLIDKAIKDITTKPVKKEEENKENSDEKPNK